MSRVLCRRGVPRGAQSAAFTADDLLDALQGNDTEYVYAELDGAGLLTGGGGAARLCVRARLAPSRPARSLELRRAAGRLLLRAERPLAPHDEPLLWFGDDALAALDMPFLTPRDVRPRPREPYACRECDAAFADPNPLKLHLFLGCRPFEPRDFWREAAARLRGAPGPAFQTIAPVPDPAELEALATEWGRSRAGHACVFCGKVYSRRYGLKIHLRTHTGYRPLRCRHCLRAFGDPSNLNKHVRLHAARGEGGEGRGGGARYTCAVCGRALARRRDLERHVRAHADIETSGDK
ncbi:unnamed protein product [Arctia plantaginis]|uniref:C2H2-type domain-containing protein n=1 Tax=Arctia plantaginis TaxID=874455 RepID=A0A8S0ZN93_ARCPL|nr:unnamed protein product [Arctia plantaginis]